MNRIDSKVIYKETGLFTTRVKHMDFSKARRNLNHEPKIPLEEGIPRTIEWMKEVYHREE